nr:craniofacial development protein 2-like [Penaeus vannamei]
MMKVRIQAKPHNISIIQCYAPTSQATEELESFYDSLRETLDNIPNRDVRVIMGDLNAKVGKLDIRHNAHGKFGQGKQNERGEKLIEFCNSNNLVITNTLLQHHPRHLCVKNTRTRPGADCNIDHQLLTMDIRFSLKKMKRETIQKRFKNKLEEISEQADYKKAFDTVVHDTLWNDMKNLGFPIHVIKLMINKRRLFERHTE